MLNQLKDMAAKQVTRVLASEATMKVLTSPQLKTVVVKAINLRAEARDAVEKRVKDVAKALELVTRDDVARMKRSIRDLQDHVDELRSQVAETKSQLDGAQADLATAKAHEHTHGAASEPAAAAPAKKAPRKTKAAS